MLTNIKRQLGTKYSGLDHKPSHFRRYSQTSQLVQDTNITLHSASIVLLLYLFCKPYISTQSKHSIINQQMIGSFRPVLL